MAQSFNEVIAATFTPLGYAHSSWCDYDLDGDLDIAVMGQTNLGARTCKVYRNNGDDTFTDMLVALPPLAFGALAWEDYDLDGDMDLAICGIDASGIRQTAIYRNTSGSFANSGISFPGISSGSIQWHDYNYDGYADLLLTGIDGNNLPQTKLFKNTTGSFSEVTSASLRALGNSYALWTDLNGDGRKDLIVQGEDINNTKHCSFYKCLSSGTLVEQTVTGISGLTDGHIAISDIDSDGKTDMAISGFNALGNRTLEVYRNTGNFLFSKVATLTGLGNSAIAFGDSDNDGDPDLIATGESSSGNTTSLYVNNGDLTFSEQSGFTGTFASSVTWADFDKDNDLDFYLSGIGAGSNYSKLSRNLSTTANTPPAVPTNLSESTFEDSVRLSWNAASDLNGGTLGYNVFIGTSKTSQNILSAHSNLASGFHWLVAQGNVGPTTSIRINELPQGKYYWSVQAIDNTYKASAFAPVDSFVICKRFSIGNDTVLCDGDAINLSAGISGDVVNWYSSSTPIIATNLLSIHHSITQNDTIWAQRSNSVSGCVTYDTINIRVNRYPSINPGTDSSICLKASLVLGGNPTATSSVFTNTYRWYPAYGLNDSTLANPTASPLVDTTYYVIVKSGACEADTADVRITIDPLPIVNASADTIIGYGQAAMLSATGANTFSWTPSISLTGALTATPKAQPAETTLYVVTGTNAAGCKDTADVKVSVENRFFIPDLFSPNGDGSNDVFLVYGVGIEKLTLRIYNQSGLEVFSSSDVRELTEIGWDGKQNGKALHGQALLWTMEGKFADGSEVSYKGKKTGSLILMK